MSVLTHFRLSERDNRGNSVVFSIAPESVDDNRENTFNTGGKDNASELVPSEVKTLGTRKISFTVTVDKQMSKASPLKVASTLRGWLQPVGASGSKDKSLHGQPPILLLTGYDIMECYLSKCDFTVKQYDVDSSDKLVTFDAKLEVVQYIDPKNPTSAWNGLGGSFGSSADLNKELSARRMKNASKQVSEAYASIKRNRESWSKRSDEQFQAVRDLVKKGLLRQDELKQMIQKHIDEEIKNIEPFEEFNLPTSDVYSMFDSAAKQAAQESVYGNYARVQHQAKFNSARSNMGLFL